LYLLGKLAELEKKKQNKKKKKKQIECLFILTLHKYRLESQRVKGEKNYFNLNQMILLFVIERFAVRAYFCLLSIVHKIVKCHGFSVCHGKLEMGLFKFVKIHFFQIVINCSVYHCSGGN